MVSSAAFYGVEQQKFGDVTASFLISLWSMIPAFIVKKSFLKAKPKVADFTIKIIDVNYDKVASTDLSKLPLAKDEEIDRYDDDRFSVKVEGFRKPILKETIENIICEYGTVKNIRVANTRSYVYAIFEEMNDAKKCIKKLNGMKYPKKAKPYEQKKLCAMKVPRIEAMSYIHGVNEQELRELWGNEHKDEVTEEEIRRYQKIWKHISECDGNFYGVDKYMVSECIRIVWKVRDKTFHIAFLDYIRNKLLMKDQTWPHWMKYFGWVFLLLWSSGCALLAIVYGISFDIKYKTGQADNFNAMGYNEQCWDMNPQLIINEELTEVFIDESINNLNNNYGTHVGDSTAWLMSLLESTLISIFIWQPLTIYFITWLMIWLFSWNLPVLLKPKILLQLFKKIYGIAPKNSEKNIDQMENEIELANKPKKISKYDRVISMSNLNSPDIPDTNTNGKSKKKKKKNTENKKRKNTVPVQGENKEKDSVPSVGSKKKKNSKKRSKSMAIKTDKNEKIANEKPPSIVVTDINNNKKEKKKKKTTDSKRVRSKTITNSKSKSPTVKKAKSPKVKVISPRNNRKISIKIVNKNGQQKSFAGIPNTVTPPSTSERTPNTPNSPRTPMSPNTPNDMKKTRAMTLNDLPKNLNLLQASNILNSETKENEEIIQFKKGGTKVIEKVNKEIDGNVEMDKRGFVVTVHHQAEQEEKHMDNFNPFDIAYGSDKYMKIVTKEQRPFDVFSFFGAEVFFLDVIKSDDGNNLDIKGYCVDEWKGDGEIVIERAETKRNAWDRVVSFH